MERRPRLVRLRLYTHFSTEKYSIPYFVQKLGSYFVLPKYTSTLLSCYTGTHSIGNRYGCTTLHSFPVTHTPTDISARLCAAMTDTTFGLSDLTCCLFHSAVLCTGPWSFHTHTCSFLPCSLQNIRCSL